MKGIKELINDVQAAAKENEISKTLVDPLLYEEDLRPLIEMLNRNFITINRRFLYEKLNTSLLQQFANSYIWSLEYDETGTFLVNKEQSAPIGLLLGYDKHTAFNLQDWYNIIDNEDRNKVRTLVESTIKTGGSFDIEYYILKRDGTKLLIRTIANVILREDNTLRIIHGIHINLAGRNIQKILHSLNSTEQLNKKQKGVIDTVNKMFFAMYYFNFETGIYEMIKCPEDFSHFKRSA
jgi:hypothetical protein